MQASVSLVTGDVMNTNQLILGNGSGVWCEDTQGDHFVEAKQVWVWLVSGWASTWEPPWGP